MRSALGEVLMRPDAVLTGDGALHIGQSGIELMKRAFVTGITGQDGAYLAQHLLELGYEGSEDSAARAR